MVEVHLNRIGGEPRPALSGAVFEVFVAGSPRSKARPRSLGTWPRSGSADVSAAIEAARAGAGAWRALDPARRLGILERAEVELGRDPDPGGGLAARLGLEPAELERHLAAVRIDLESARRDRAAAISSPRAAEPGLLILAPGWSELVAPVAAALFSALRLGRSVLLLSDPHAPMIGDALAGALERAGLPRGVLSVLHDDGEDALRAAMRSGAATNVRASGYPSRIRRLERMTARGNGADFGAGLATSSAPVPAPGVELSILRCKTAVLRSSENPAARAAEIVDRSFGRSASLSGQLPGQVGRVVCPDRSFSRFTEALLAELRRSQDVARPAPLVERESEDRLRRARILGLDEGATLIFDGEDALAAESGEPARSLQAAAEFLLAPTVFTNVEERMRLTLLGRPLPLLCLLRVSNDEQARELAERLDREVPAEDLSLDAPE